MSEEKIVGILQKVKTPCIRCSNDVVGFLIPDGRFICPQCDPPAIYERWKREWEPHKQEILRKRKEEREARVAAEKEEQDKQRAEWKRKLAEKEKSDEAIRQQRQADWEAKNKPSVDLQRKKVRKISEADRGSIILFVCVVLIIAGALFAGPLVLLGCGVLFGLSIATRLSSYINPAPGSTERISTLGRDVAITLLMLVIGGLWFGVSLYNDAQRRAEDAHERARHAAEEAYDRGATDQLDSVRRQLRQQGY